MNKCVKKIQIQISTSIRQNSKTVLVFVFSLVCLLQFNKNNKLEESFEEIGMA